METKIRCKVSKKNRKSFFKVLNVPKNKIYELIIILAMLIILIFRQTLGMKKFLV